MVDDESSNSSSASEDEGESSSSSSESDDGVILDLPDEEFFKTLSCLKTKDPRIYDSNVQFFTKPPLAIQDKSNSKKKEIKTDEVSNEMNCENRQGPYKFSLKEVDIDSSSDEDEMSAFKAVPNDKPEETEKDNEYVEFLKGEKSKIENEEAETTLKPLQEYWNANELDEKEKFLKDYLLNKKYLGTGPNILTDDTNLSDDERELEEQAQYEINYNFRFENDDNAELKRFPRNIEGSVRKKNDKRKRKRAEINERKKEEKSVKQQEIKKKQKEKLSEIEEKINKLKELTGNPELGFKDDEILEDFDPEKHDKKMQELFNEDYYNQDEEEHPAFDEREEDDWDNGEINMDCDEDLVEKKEKLTRSQKKKLKKKKTYQDVLDIVKPAFDPNVHSNFKKYIDDYYSLDCEDFIDDIPCKFKYREVVPNDYGLSIEEILMADDQELNRWASVKKIVQRRSQHVEKNEVKIYSKKAQNEELKKKLLPSLYKPPDEEAETKSTINSDKKEPSSVDAEFSSRNLDTALQSENILKENKTKINSESDDFNIDGLPKPDQNPLEHSKMLGKSTLIETSKKRKKRKRKQKNKNSLSETIPNGEIKEETKNQTVILENTSNTSASVEVQKKKRRKKKKTKHFAEKNNTSENQLIIKDETKPLDDKTLAIKTENTGDLEINQKLHHLKAENDIDAKNNQSKPVLNSVNSKKKKNRRKMKNKGNSNESSKTEGIKRNKQMKKKKKDGVVNLSDSRLLAYGIKPKKFRSKMLYSVKKENS